MGKLTRELRRRLEFAHGGSLGGDDEAAFRQLEMLAAVAKKDNPKPYEFDRKFLFKVLCLGNSQLAQIVGARGPNAQTNAACAGTTQAVAIAEDMLRAGRCERVVVVAGDNASSPALLPWLGNGFRALGAASTAAAVADAALPFDRRRNGMLLGAGAVGMVLETAAAYAKRVGVGRLPPGFGFDQCSGAGGGPGAIGGEVQEGRAGVQGQQPEWELPKASAPPLPPQPKARLVATQYSNSAFHGAALDRRHIASELKRFLAALKAEHGISPEQIARRGVYLSHETCTHASPSSSCAFNEIGALRDAFGKELLPHLLILNTKGFTGHAMGASFEDVTAVEILRRQAVPPNANSFTADPHLGDIKLSTGGAYSADYALRFSAGFGSHVCFALYSALTAPF